VSAKPGQVHHGWRDASADDARGKVGAPPSHQRPRFDTIPPCFRSCSPGRGWRCWADASWRLSGILPPGPQPKAELRRALEMRRQMARGPWWN